MKWKVKRKEKNSLEEGVFFYMGPWVPLPDITVMVDWVLIPDFLPSTVLVNLILQP